MGMFGWLFGKKKKGKKKRPVAGKRPRPAAQRPKGAPPAAAQRVAEPPQVEPPPAGYFEVPLPDGEGVCSDGECMCGGALIARGTGYLYIDRNTVDFRRNAPSVEQARDKKRRLRSQMGVMDEAAAIHGRVTALLICEHSARRREIDLEVAAADAGHWWETGYAPLRATPEAKPAAVEPVAEEPAEKPKPKARRKAGPKAETDEAEPKARRKARPKAEKAEPETEETEPAAKKAAPKARRSTKSASKKKKEEEGEVETQG